VETLTQQLYAFVVMAGAGGVLGAIYDVFRVVRAAFGPRSAVAWLCDVLYWAAAAPVAAVLLLRANGGELRFYVLLGAAAGLTLYFGLLSPLVTETLRALLRAVGWVAAWVVHAAWSAVTWPVMLARSAAFAWRARRAALGGRSAAGGPSPGMLRRLEGLRRGLLPWRPPLAWRKR